MKRLIFVSIVALTLLVLTIGGDRILSRALDAELAPLLTRQLGLPVQLAPINAKILTLTAITPKLVMGDPNNPAIVATDLEVTLTWADLLHREIRLVTASADDLMVRLENWPVSDKPWPDNYRFLDPWLPKNLQFNTGRYIADDGGRYPLRAFRWQRKPDGGATLAWSEDRAGGEVVLDVELKSLDDLLRLSPIQLDLAIAVTGKKSSKILLQAGIGPGKVSGYTLDTRVQAADISAHIVATSATPWRLPDQSSTKASTVAPDKLIDLINHYAASADSPDADSLLASALPDLSLPDHQGNVEIDEIRIRDEVGKNNSFDFTTKADGLKISSLTSQGPEGILHGQFDIASSTEGWQFKLDAEMQARRADDSIAAHYLGAEWLWRTGRTRLNGRGATWGELLNSMEGDITLAGAHRGEIETPVKIEARLDNHPGEFRLNQMDIEVGSGRITGSAALSDTKPRKLAIDIKGEQLHLDFLFSGQEGTYLPGTAIPEYLDFLPGIDIDLQLKVKDLQAPDMHLARADISLQRAPKQGVLTLHADGVTGGKLDLRLEASTPLDNEPGDYTLTANISEFDIPRFFQQEMLVQSRSTGTISFKGRGMDLDEVFKALRGKTRLTVDYRLDSNWQRSSTAEEHLSFSGDTALVIEGDRIIGLQISQLDIESIRQDVTGDVSVVDGRTPWLIARLEAEKLNVDAILALLPGSTEQADQTDLLMSLKKLGAVQLSLDATSVVVMDQSLSDMKLELSSRPDLFTVNRLDFAAEDSHLESHGEISWKGDSAALKASVNVTDFDLDRFLIESPSITHVPISGSINLASEGSRYSQLLANLSGRVNLQASRAPADSSPKSRRNLAMQIKRVPDGVHAQISTLQLGENELSGSLRYHKTSPPFVEVQINGGSLSLLPWEESFSATEEKKQTKKGEVNNVTEAASASAGFVTNILLKPIRFFTGPEEATPGEQYFSDNPLPFNALGESNAKVSGQIESLTSTAGVAKKLTFSGTLKDGRLSGQASAGSLNGGTGEIEVDINANGTTPSAQVTASFRGLTGQSGKNTFPRSGFFSLTSKGHTEAELAANLNGTLYLELGQGPFDYKSLSFINTDVATNMFRTLIPGIEKHTPEMECGVTLVTFKDGTGITPYGFAARTNSANLLGRVEVDLKKEMVQLEFDSRSREGVGISVGSVFANTVQVKGPLTDPRIVPDTSSILWRGWAAFMTAGLSVVGESVFKRALASSDPCKAIKKDIREDLCKTNQPAASSPLVCPKG